MNTICTGEPFDETIEREKKELNAQFRQVAIGHRNESSTEYDALEVDLYM